MMDRGCDSRIIRHELERYGEIERERITSFAVIHWRFW
jgi:hypothetical protein